ncbi:DUF3347 domain-containing protein [Jiulongibacter sediminis]|uniref:DUF3347 domain-containing protein n=1 Tax=Jiulongibacter sediminis TaxID=1605367 RepID=UPI0006DCE7CC|nr:DUF3347 domain-containing protein [Jiulongibacter sediminis]MCR9065191.1 DUF3347 domain-containing protein [Cytophagales bacterium]
MKSGKIFSTALIVLLINSISLSFAFSELSETPLKQVYLSYFELKNTLVNSDKTESSSKAEVLLSSFDQVDMKTLSHESHMVWMKVLPVLKKTTSAINSSKSIEEQRSHFSKLSDNLYIILKSDKQAQKTYYQFCPMANDGKGANWLSEFSAVKNPYFGSSMLTCGKTKETLN